MHLLPGDLFTHPSGAIAILAAAALGGLFSGPGFGFPRLAAATLVSGLLSVFMVQVALASPLSLGPEALWLGVSAGAAGVLFSGRNPAWALVAVAQAFLPIWAGWGALNVVTIGFCAWRHQAAEAPSGDLKASQIAALLALQSLLLLTPLAARAPGLPLMGWGVGVYVLWTCITAARFQLLEPLRRAIAIGAFVLACLGFIALSTSPGGIANQLLVLIPSLVIAEAAGRPLLPWWWFFVLPGMLYAGFQSTETLFELVLLLPLVAGLTALLRSGSPATDVDREEGAKVPH